MILLFQVKWIIIYVIDYIILYNTFIFNLNTANLNNNLFKSNNKNII